MAAPETMTVKVAPDTTEFDQWLAQINLLLHKISFSIDGYLLTRPSTTEEGGRDA